MNDVIKNSVEILVKDSISKDRYLRERSDVQLVDCTIPFAMIHKFIVDSADEPFAALQINSSASQVGLAIIDLVEKSPLREFLSIDREQGYLIFSKHLSRSDRIEIANHLISKTGAIA